MTPERGSLSTRPCYVCRRSPNRVVATEPIEHRQGRPVLPEDTYVFVRCHSCGSLYVDSDVSDEYLRDLYAEETVESIVEAIGQSHDEVVAPRLPEFRLHWAEMKGRRPPLPGDELLDVGCQTGEFGSLALRDGVRPHGIELSATYAASAREAWGDGSEVHSGTLQTAEFHPGQFAYISAFETLEHMCDPVEALRVLRGWISTDGILAISVPSADYFHFKYWVLKESALSPVAKWLVTRLKGAYRDQALPHTHIYNFSHRSVRLLLERGGFCPVCISSTGWNGRISPVGRLASRMLETVPRAEISLAPSLFAIARPASEGWRHR